MDILLENIPNELSSAERLLQFEELTHLGMNYVFDTGHAHMNEGVETAFHLLKEKIRSTHVHDNDGKSDTHVFPFVGTGGTIDWKNTMQLLRSRGDQFPLLLELKERPEFPQPARGGQANLRPGSKSSRPISSNDPTRSIHPQSAAARPRRAVTAQGWVKTRRDSKNVHFVQLNDGSSPVDLQVVLDEGVVRRKWSRASRRARASAWTASWWRRREKGRRSS